MNRGCILGRLGYATQLQLTKHTLAEEEGAGTKYHPT